MTTRDIYRICISIVSLALLCSAIAVARDDDGFAAQRRQMLDEIRGTAQDANAKGTGGVIDEAVLAAMGAVPRHRFVPADELSRAYANRPLPIGHGQTISQPYIVALMTDLLDVEAGDRVFELGTGSGYQAAVLAELGCEVWTMEIIPELGKRAASVLSEVGYDRVHARIGDAYFGWQEAAPFDAVVVTAAGDHIPPPLIEQLAPGGRMIIPVGSGFMTQQLILVEKLEDGGVRTQELLPVAFVPLTGSH